MRVKVTAVRCCPAHSTRKAAGELGWAACVAGSSPGDGDKRHSPSGPQGAKRVADFLGLLLGRHSGLICVHHRPCAATRNQHALSA